MKAIPQLHNGIAYRSRTEARWAEFFSLTSIPFEYEPEGFDVGGEWYVPDFRLNRSVYFEVKGTSPNERERRLAQGLAELTNAPVVLAAGNPGMAKLLAYGVAKTETPCVVVDEYRRDDGAWVAEFADGGGWALPLCGGLVNCAATGAEHSLLAEAGRLQFRKPIGGDHGFQGLDEIVTDLVRRLMTERAGK